MTYLSVAMDVAILPPHGNHEIRCPGSQGNGLFSRHAYMYWVIGEKTMFSGPVYTYWVIEKKTVFYKACIHVLGDREKTMFSGTVYTYWAIGKRQCSQGLYTRIGRLGKDNVLKACIHVLGDREKTVFSRPVYTYWVIGEKTMF